ncbi:MAG: DnaB-like helicase N-terminal domain-containing protein, partial [Syntrophorhabdus sp.]
MARSIRNARETKAQATPHIPPQNLEAEQSLLGGLLVDPESINKIVDMVGPGDFYKDAHSKIYDVMLDLYERNEAIDIITVSSLARDKGLVEKIGGIT